ncbi:sensor histidine kinase [Saccharospirillum salsuginis]|uniref:histidine kinase n=1 Tax=Saccharospirillum salsuginis TaxID=418750 RepID=A0A918JZD8_9GAMM|nr:ATP-binding protein [Saccharospirillum salsuginis]GGX39777.1 sensor histidine kinase [Saccharospirillum salsuginis]
MPRDPRGRRRPSLERGIRFRLLVVLVLVMGGVLVFVDIAVSRLSRDFVLTRLEHDAESLITSLVVAGPDDWRITDNQLPSVYQRAHSGHYYILSGPDRTDRSRSLWDLTFEVERLLPGETRVGIRRELNGQTWLVWQLGFEKGGQVYSLWIAEDLAPLQMEQRRFESVLLLLVLVAVAVLLWMQRRVLRRGFARLKPLQRELEAHRLGIESQIPESLPEEVAPLVDALLSVLERSDQQIRRSRTALGNLSHELKRPLQQLHSLADRQSGPDDREALMRVYHQLHERIDRELRRARIAGTPSPGRRFAPAEELPYLVDMMSRLYREAPRVELDLPDVDTLPFDRDDVLELLGNLLDNACRHARSRVRLSLRRVETAWRWDVEDDGAGVVEADYERLAGRGVRLDESDRTERGHGLGLSICQAVVDSYRGEMTFDRSTLGGLRVRVVLPVP